MFSDYVIPGLEQCSYLSAATPLNQLDDPKAKKQTYLDCIL